MFLTLTSSEHQWPTLLNTLYYLKYGKFYDGDILKVYEYDKSILISKDLITCNLVFNKFVKVMLHILKSISHSLFGKHYLKDYFLRVGFQKRGSPRVHILLWLNNDPKEIISKKCQKL